MGITRDTPEGAVGANEETPGGVFTDRSGTVEGGSAAASGRPGPQGPAGPPGMDGMRGPEGPASTVPGPQGDQGPQGQFTVTLFQRGSTTPPAPTGTWTYDPTTRVGTYDDSDGWRDLISSLTGTDQIYESIAEFDPAGSATTITSWSAPFQAGSQGPAGVTPNVQVGTTTTGNAGTNAAVVRRSGSPDSAPIFDFAIPRGDTGAKGDGGDTGATPNITVTSQVTNLPAGSTGTVVRSGTDEDPVLTFSLPQGADGAAGEGWTGGSYDTGTGIVTFTSDDGLGFTTGDLRGLRGPSGPDGAPFSIRNISVNRGSAPGFVATPVSGVAGQFDLVITLVDGNDGMQGDQGIGVTGVTSSGPASGVPITLTFTRTDPSGSTTPTDITATFNVPQGGGSGTFTGITTGAAFDGDGTANDPLQLRISAQSGSRVSVLTGQSPASNNGLFVDADIPIETSLPAPGNPRYPHESEVIIYDPINSSLAPVLYVNHNDTWVEVAGQVAGTTGPMGRDGNTGASTLIGFQRSATALTRPADSPRLPAGYTATIPTGTDDLYVIFGQRAAGATDYLWTTPTTFVGDDGAQGFQGRYRFFVYTVQTTGTTPNTPVGNAAADGTYTGSDAGTANGQWRTDFPSTIGTGEIRYASFTEFDPANVAGTRANWSAIFEVSLQGPPGPAGDDGSIIGYYDVTGEVNTGDIVIRSTTDGTLYRYVNATGIAADPTRTTVSDFTDTSLWMQVGGGAVAIDSLNDIDDVEITSVASNDTLRWNGTDWVNGPIIVNVPTTGVATVFTGDVISDTDDYYLYVGTTVLTNLSATTDLSGTNFLQLGPLQDSSGNFIETLQGSGRLTLTHSGTTGTLAYSNYVSVTTGMAAVTLNQATDRGTIVRSGNELFVFIGPANATITGSTTTANLRGNVNFDEFVTLDTNTNFVRTRDIRTYAFTGGTTSTTSVPNSTLTIQLTAEQITELDALFGIGVRDPNGVVRAGATILVEFTDGTNSEQYTVGGDTALNNPTTITFSGTTLTLANGPNFQPAGSRSTYNSVTLTGNVEVDDPRIIGGTNVTVTPNLATPNDETLTIDANFTERNPGIPDVPTRPTDTTQYNLQYGATGDATWVIDTAPDIPNLPTRPTATTQYNLQYGTTGDATWVTDTAPDIPNAPTGQNNDTTTDYELRVAVDSGGDRTFSWQETQDAILDHDETIAYPTTGTIVRDPSDNALYRNVNAIAAPAGGITVITITGATLARLSNQNLFRILLPAPGMAPVSGTTYRLRYIGPAGLTYNVTFDGSLVNSSTTTPPTNVPGSNTVWLVPINAVTGIAGYPTTGGGLPTLTDVDFSSGATAPNPRPSLANGPGGDWEQINDVGITHPSRYNFSVADQISWLENGTDRDGRAEIIRTLDFNFGTGGNVTYASNQFTITGVDASIVTEMVTADRVISKADAAPGFGVFESSGSGTTLILTPIAGANDAGFVSQAVVREMSANVATAGEQTRNQLVAVDFLQAAMPQPGAAHFTLTLSPTGAHVGETDVVVTATIVLDAAYRFATTNPAVINIFLDSDNTETLTPSALTGTGNTREFTFTVPTSTTTNPDEYHVSVMVNSTLAGTAQATSPAVVETFAITAVPAVTATISAVLNPDPIQATVGGTSTLSVSINAPYHSPTINNVSQPTPQAGITINNNVITVDTTVPAGSYNFDVDIGYRTLSGATATIQNQRYTLTVAAAPPPPVQVDDWYTFIGATAPTAFSSFASQGDVPAAGGSDTATGLTGVANGRLYVALPAPAYSTAFGDGGWLFYHNAVFTYDTPTQYTTAITNLPTGYNVYLVSTNDYNGGTSVPALILRR